MLALSLRGLATRKLRTALTAFAVVLGVALVSGTYLLTDTIDRSFDEVFQTANQGSDVVLTPKQHFSDDAAGQPAPLKQDIVAQVRRVPGVALAAGTIFEAGQIYDKDNDPLITTGAPMFISGTSPPRFAAFTYGPGKGHGPTAPNEVALDQNSVNKAGFELGDTVRVSGKGPQRPFKLVGIAQFGGNDSLAGAAVAIVQTAVAQQLLDLHGQYDQINVAGDAGITPRALAQRVRTALPADAATVRTGAQEARSQADSVKQQLGFLQTLLLVFAGIALFVGAFLIANTFSITVAQRVREFALLRMIGASRRQVLRTVIGEALVIGLGASIVGFFIGFGLAPALKGLFSLFGADLPSSGIVLHARTVIVSLLVGTLITLVSATAPAVRATRVPPIAALQESASLPRGRYARWRTPLAIGVLVIGVALLCIGLFGNANGGSAAALVGAGAAIMFIGAGLLASHAVGPLATAVGRPMEAVRGVPGRLARENAMRNPRRTASTSAALMIGVALVAFVTIFAAGLKASVANAVSEGLEGQLIVEGTSFSPVPPSAKAVVAQQPGIGTVSAIRFGEGRVPGVGKVAVSGIDPRTIGDVFHVNWVQGSDATARDLAPGQALVEKSWAKDHDAHVGSRVSVDTPTGTTVPFQVAGIYEDKAHLLGDLTVPNVVLTGPFNVTQDAFLMATTTPGSNPDTVEEQAGKALKAQYPSLKVLTKQGFIDEQKGQVDTLVTLFYVLLALAIVISIFGIVNTLFLTIHERTRELGMLRAIGTSRRQVRQIVRYESVITAMIGAVLGVVLGAIFAVLVTIPLKSEGFTISIPIGSLVIVLVLAAVVGVLAAIWPARRAAKLDVLQALAYE